ncbi:MAG: DUF3592 domain-containing protein [Candidatus Obscuribacterales bacterium]|nr:DUF3592 domain-containing protein [Candidatus Obscuribacterales bacterium]
MVRVEASLARKRKVFTILFRVYACLFLIATTCTIFSLVSVNDLLANSSHVNGLVVDTTYGSKGRRAPVVRFQIANGEMLVLKSDFYTSSAPNVGDTVKVVYRTSNPRDWRIDDWMHLYFWTLMGSIFMFAWAMAIILTMLIGRNLAKKIDASA